MKNIEFKEINPNKENESSNNPSIFLKNFEEYIKEIPINFSR